LRGRLWRLKYILAANSIELMGLLLISVNCLPGLGLAYIATGVGIRAVFRADGSLRAWVAG
jgi:hypothetical protein